MVDLCSLLNSGGGVLLFSCKKVYLEVRVVGECFIEEDKDSYIYVLKQAMKKIHPVVEMQK